MKKVILTGLIALLVIGCNNNAGNFQRLSDKSCVPYTQASPKPALTEEWQPYLASTQICPLVKKAGDKPAIMLVSVSLAEATVNKNESDLWDSIPKPMLINEKGLCVARLPYLYPDDPPFEMQLSIGQWKGNIPGEIRLHILNQAVDGDFDLPTLIWDSRNKKYEPEKTATGDDNESQRIRCPIK